MSNRLVEATGAAGSPGAFGSPGRAGTLGASGTVRTPGAVWTKAAFVIVFAAAMAWMEAATVLYLRTLVDRVDPYQLVPFPVSFGWARVELVRELATLVMLAAAAGLAGGDRRERFGYWLVAFGTWDILYYVVLAAVSPWPRSILDWDLLFLLPLPWWGPIWAPMAIAMLMIATGALILHVSKWPKPLWPSRRAWLTCGLGVVMALTVFMTDAIGAIEDGPVAVRQVLPEHFEWRGFLIALVLMAVLPASLVRGALARYRQGAGERRHRAAGTGEGAGSGRKAGVTAAAGEARAVEAVGATGAAGTAGAVGAPRVAEAEGLSGAFGAAGVTGLAATVPAPRVFRPLGPEFRVSGADGSGMRVCTDRVRLRTDKRLQFIDLTELVEERVRRSGIHQGLVLVQTRHTTASIVVNENEPLLLDDLEALLERLAPRHIDYRHNDLGARSGHLPPGERPNGHSHARALLLGHEGSLCVEGGRIQLGRWQRIFLVELDGGRDREVSILALGCARSAA